jgi:hypothetical protein
MMERMVSILAGPNLKADLLNNLGEKIMKRRLKAWRLATEIVNPIVEQHGVEDIVAGGIPAFVSTGKVTKTQQHISLIETVANWLLWEDEEDE